MKSRLDRLYCAKCKNRPTCTTPCTPVELLLKTVTTREEHERELPREFVRQTRCLEDYPEPDCSKKQLIIDLFYLDGRTRKEISLLVGATYEQVKKTIQRENLRIRAKVASSKKITNYKVQQKAPH